MRRAYWRALAALAHCMAWSTSFELAITPHYAGHYGRLRADLEHWLAVYHRYWLRSL